MHEEKLRKLESELKEKRIYLDGDLFHKWAHEILELMGFIQISGEGETRLRSTYMVEKGIWLEKEDKTSGSSQRDGYAKGKSMVFIISYYTDLVERSYKRMAGLGIYCNSCLGLEEKVIEFDEIGGSFQAPTKDCLVEADGIYLLRPQHLLKAAKEHYRKE